MCMCVCEFMLLFELESTFFSFCAYVLRVLIGQAPILPCVLGQSVHSVLTECNYSSLTVNNPS